MMEDVLERYDPEKWRPRIGWDSIGIERHLKLYGPETLFVDTETCEVWGLVGIEKEREYVGRVVRA